MTGPEQIKKENILFKMSCVSDNCSYGDKSTICQSESGHGSYCYNNTIRDLCCESCLNVQTDDPGNVFPFIYCFKTT